MSTDFAHIEQCIDIIRATHDGDDLAPEHLYLVQTACNGWLTEAGRQAFEALHHQVSTGTYVKPSKTTQPHHEIHPADH